MSQIDLAPSLRSDRIACYRFDLIPPHSGESRADSAVLLSIARAFPFGGVCGGATPGAMSSSKQALIYSFVAKGSVVLAEHTAFSGNFSTVAVQCLQKLPPNSTRSTYSCDGHTFNFLVDRGFGTVLFFVPPSIAASSALWY